jgi:hypothetical protein
MFLTVVFHIKKYSSKAWWYVPTVPELRRLLQGNPLNP